MNKKCPNCGFINFVSAEVCHKCETVVADVTGPSFYDSPPTYRGPVNAYRQPYPKRSGSQTLKMFVWVGVGVAMLVVAAGWGVSVVTRGRNRQVKWIEYRPNGLDFTVMMPNTPTPLEPVMTQYSWGNTSNHRYVSTITAQGTAMFCFVDYVGPVFEKEQAEEGLKAEFDSFLQRSNSTLVSKKMITYLGMPGLEFEITPPANMKPKGGRSYGKMFLSLNRLYVFSITAAEGSDLLAGKEAFLNPKLPPNPFG